jgi:exonuclease SbcD
VNRKRPLRVLLLADTHLGFDLPARPRIERRRRGHDFLANFRRALEPARRGRVDLVVHGGDLLFRSRVVASLVQQAMAPVFEVADAGTPVFIVPGNHERSRIPYPLLAVHPRVHVFHQPETFLYQGSGPTVALSGFPYQRKIRERFPELVARTRYWEPRADIRLLCLHQAVEGARVGPAGFTFRRQADVIRGRDLPGAFAAVLSGHIHRSQMLVSDLRGDRLPAPVIYPGSVERTSFAERNEEKHFVVLELESDGGGRGRARDVRFQRLPSRPMVRLDVDLSRRSRRELADLLRERFSRLDPDAVVIVRWIGSPPGEAPAPSTAWVRDLAPPAMNVTVARDRREPPVGRGPLRINAPRRGAASR